MKHFTPEEYKAITVVRPRATRRKKPIAPGSTKISVGKKIPITNYVNIGLGVTFAFLMLRAFLPALNPFSTIEDNIVATFSHLRGTTVTFDWKTLTDPAKVQKAMAGTSGGFAVIDSSGELIAGVNEKDQLHPASVAKLLTTAAAMEKYPIGHPKSVLSTRRIAALKAASASSNNVYFDALADEIGTDYIQESIRKITKNDSILIGNGSGCNDYTTSSGRSSCGGSTRTGRPTKISTYDIVKVVKHMDQALSKTGMGLEDVTGSTDNNSTVAGRYAGSLNRKITAKTGSLPSQSRYALAGKIYGPDGEVVYFATITIGDKRNMITKHIKVINSVYPKSN
jgi:hypothetical protein